MSLFLFTEILNYFPRSNLSSDHVGTKERCTWMSSKSYTQNDWLTIELTTGQSVFRNPMFRPFNMSNRGFVEYCMGRESKTQECLPFSHSTHKRITFAVTTWHFKAIRTSLHKTLKTKPTKVPFWIYSHKWLREEVITGTVRKQKDFYLKKEFYVRHCKNTMDMSVRK